MEDSDSTWTFRDVFLSLGIATDPVLLGIGYVGLVAAGGLYGFFYFLGNATGEQGARSTFSVLGGISFIGISILTAGVLARIVVIRLLEGRRATTREIWDYVKNRAQMLLLIPACFAGIVLVALGGVGALELLGRLPGLGPILFGASFTVAFLLSLVAVLAFFIHTLGSLLYPAMLATRSEGVLAVVGEILALARLKGAQLLVYSMVILAAGTASTLFLAFVVSLALAVTASSANSLMGEKFGMVLAGLPSIFRPFLDMFGAAVGPVPTGVDVPWHYDFGGLLVGVSLLSIFAATAAYPFAMITSAGTITYFILTDEPLPETVPHAGPTDDAEIPEADEEFGSGVAEDPSEYEP